jgi:hypothetical protein
MFKYKLDVKKRESLEDILLVLLIILSLVLGDILLRPYI